jgi:hypothetical protein
MWLGPNHWYVLAAHDLMAVAAVGAAMLLGALTLVVMGCLTALLCGSTGSGKGNNDARRV